MCNIDLNREIALYIHIPFCKSKCNYCDFNSYQGREKEIPLYFDALKKEIENYKIKLSGYSIKTVFIGGGTPSLAESHYITELLNLIRLSFKLNFDAEISIETNPGTLSYNKLTEYKSAGINRLSIGLQAWQDELLKSLGRIHTSQEFEENFKLARKAGFENINVDIIFGLPGQTIEDFNQTLKNVMNLKPEHISCYSLKIEEGTAFGNMLSKGEFNYPDEELDREMYYLAINLLGKSGYKHYEISNFAKSGFQCRHNLVYWNSENYLGIGAGAHSYLYGKRYNNVSSIDGYIKGLVNNEAIIENTETIDLHEKMSEYMILGLRLIDGVSSSKFMKLFEKDIFEVFGSEIERLIEKGMLEINEDSIKLTSFGIDFANQVFVEFI